ncbi:MAG: hypothetical protein PF503_02035, partial [Desulfobacula sp.]|nr:hypothetical protein [Desulfobacula sp.]
THPSTALLQNPEILMYSSTLRFQDFLRLVYGQLFAQTPGFRSGTTIGKNTDFQKKKARCC